MTPDDLLEAVREAKATELSRLGSSKALYAATAGEIEADRVLQAAATAERAAAETFDAWADDEANEAAAAAFRATAEEEHDHFERVREELDEDGDEEPADEDGEDLPALAAHLRGIDDTVARAGALLGRILVADESKSQYIGYFVGDADPQTASVFRDLRGDLDGQQERALDLLETVCDDDGDWERAESAALDAIDAAYEAQVEALESLGVNPKPVC
ncbi:rubrerythrin family protein [Haloparvum sp. PAK95]|uniref:rubrerythrin family protein n=1 Tax=Haloparvum sp. PAK95 TaxID=3418962 RepID=UPI003D2EBBA9